jgi:hypothetical protein
LLALGVFVGQDIEGFVEMDVHLPADDVQFIFRRNNGPSVERSLSSSFYPANDEEGESG